MTDRSPDIHSDAIPPDRIDPAQGAQDATATSSKGKSRSMIREVIETLLLALIIFVAVRAVVLNFRVEGHSMDHTLANGEMLLVNRNAYFAFDQSQWLNWIPGVEFDEDDAWRPFGTPERGDIVVLHPPEEGSTSDKPYIKRVIGVGGDTVEIKDGGVYINGVRLVEDYLDEGLATECNGGKACVQGAVQIPEGYVWVMGDNRGHSEDSRSFGIVPIENLVGKTWVTYWPSDKIGIVDHEAYPELQGPTQP